MSHHGEQAYATWRRVLLALGMALIGAADGCSDPGPAHSGLAIRVEGLPSGVAAAITVSGPSAYYKQVADGTMIQVPAAGQYVVAVHAVSTPDAYYAARDSSLVLDLSPDGASDLTVTYELAGGSVRLNASGLPASLSANVTISDAHGARRLVSGQVTGGIPAGDYQVSVANVASVDGDTYSAASPPTTIHVSASRTAVDLTVNFAMTTGILALSVDGLTVNATPVRITGPGAFARSVAASATLHGLEPGTYAVDAAGQAACPFQLVPRVATQTVTVRAGVASAASVAYDRVTPSPATLDLRVAGVELLQVIQSTGTSVPAIAGRPTLARIFVVANQCNAVSPRVTVTLDNARQVTVAADAREVPVDAGSSDVAKSWNILLDAQEVTTSLQFTVDVDPDGAVTESDKSNNRFVFRGSGMIQDVPAFDLTVLPLIMPGAADPAITSANLDEYMQAIHQMMPIGKYNIHLGAPFQIGVTYNYNDVPSITTALQAVEIKRVADGATGYYMALVRPFPGAPAGISMGLIGGKSVFANDPGFVAPALRPSIIQNLAHELGHNFGRFHAPACSPPGPDPNYPYPQGVTNTVGYNVWSAAAAGDPHPAFMPATMSDIMGYCMPAWISDYSYMGMLRFRAQAASAPVPAREPSLVISGHVYGGVARIDTSFVALTRPVVPSKTGAYRIVARDAKGSELLGASFDLPRLDHADSSVGFFVYALPLGELDARRIRTFELLRSQSLGNARLGSTLIARRAGM